MKIIALAEAAADLNRLVADIANGETYVITDGDTPVARLIPVLGPNGSEQRTVRDLVEEWEVYRREHNITLGGEITIRELIEEGRKY